MRMAGVLLCLLWMGCAAKEPNVPTQSPDQAKRLELAEEQLKAGKWEEARSNFKAVRELMLGREPVFVAQAEWGLARVAEKQGQNIQALAHLMSAENLKADLPPEVGLAEIPAKKAFILHKMGRKAEAMEALQAAESGIRQLQRQPTKNEESDWLIKLYYQMGTALTEPVTDENFEGFIEAQRASQIFLLRALVSTSPQWSEAAAEALRKSYLEFWTYLTQERSSTLPPSMAAREHRTRQIPQLGEFVKTLELAQAYAPVNPHQVTRVQKDFYAMVDELIEKSRKVLYSNSETLVLTEESRRLNSLRRGPEKATPSVKEKATPPAALPSEDPNL